MNEPKSALFTGAFLIALLGAGCGENGAPSADGEPGAQPVTEVEETTPSAGESLPPAGAPLPDSPDTAPLPTPSEELRPTDTTPRAEAPPAGLADEEVAPMELESATGVVGISGTGAAPTAVLRREEGGALGLTGTTARELMALSGATIRVEGRRAATPVGPGLEVTGYELLEIEGSAPHMGILARDPAGNWILHTQDDRTLHLVGLPQASVEEGMKVWVIGEMEAEDRFLVNSYGVVALGSAS